MTHVQAFTLVSHHLQLPFMPWGILLLLSPQNLGLIITQHMPIANVHDTSLISWNLEFDSTQAVKSRSVLV